ncbi:MAG: hypothetical protein QM783_18305 [Phycisphaerales bacterium]
MRAVASLAVAAFLCVGLSGVAVGGVQPQQTVAEKRTADAMAALQKALDESKANDKVLLVTFNSDAGRAKANEQVLSTPVTAGWIARHASVYAVTDQGLITGLSNLKFWRKGKDGQPEEDPSRKLVQSPGGDPLLYTDGVIELLDKKSSIILPNSPKADPKTTAGQGSLALAMRMDWTLRSPNASEDFRKRHWARLAPAVWPGSGGGAGGKSTSILKGLTSARALARDKKWDQAANEYANLWMETGGGGNAVAAPIRVGEMAAEMALVAQQSPGAKDRLIGLRNEYGRAMDVSDPRQVHEYLILCRVIGDHEHNLRFLDDATQGKSALSMVPAADLLAYDWMMPRCHWNDPNEGVSKPGAWIGQLARQCDKMAAGKDAAIMTSAVEYGRWLARVEAARRMTWLLMANKDDRAMEVRDAALAADKSPEMRRALVVCALAAGQKRPWLAEVLKGVTDDELSAELAK